jgi:hypothetical protein
MSIWDYTGRAKDVAAVLGVGGVMFSVYSASGLPIPATAYQVDLRVKPIEQSVVAISADVIDTQRSVLAMRRTFLRNELYTISRSIETGDASTKITLTRRVGEIQDEISEIEKKDDALAVKARELKPRS